MYAVHMCYRRRSRTPASASPAPVRAGVRTCGRCGGVRTLLARQSPVRQAARIAIPLVVYVIRILSQRTPGVARAPTISLWQSILRGRRCFPTCTPTPMLAVLSKYVSWIAPMSYLYPISISPSFIYHCQLIAQTYDRGANATGQPPAVAACTEA